MALENLSEMSSQAPLGVFRFLPMTTYRGLTELTVKTILSVVDADDFDAVRFDINLQARLAKQVSSLDRLNAAVATCDEQMRKFIHSHEDDPRNIEYARGALRLKEWLMRPPGGGYVQNGTGFSPRV